MENQEIVTAVIAGSLILLPFAFYFFFMRIERAGERKSELEQEGVTECQLSREFEARAENLAFEKRARQLAFEKIEQMRLEERSNQIAMEMLQDQEEEAAKEMDDESNRSKDL
ncbi:hypothetical protein OAG48_00320 [bacterium]|nr:hypothetical protein [bacterium]